MKAMEKISLAKEYRVVEWLQDAYMELTLKTFSSLDIEELRPAEPYHGDSNPQDRDSEADIKKWEPTVKDWEMLLKISRLQTTVAFKLMSNFKGRFHCANCDKDYGSDYKSLCKCRLLVLVNETFRRELESFRESPEHDEHLQVKPRPARGTS